MVLTVLNTRCRSRQETRALSTGSWFSRPHGSAERGSPTWYRPLDEGPVVGTGLDDGVHHARHLGGDRGQRLAPQVGIVPVAGDVALELVAEAVLPLPDGHLPSQPKRTPEPGVAVLRRLVWPRKVPDCWVARSRPQNFRN